MLSSSNYNTLGDRERKEKPEVDRVLPGQKPNLDSALSSGLMERRMNSLWRKITSGIIFIYNDYRVHLKTGLTGLGQKEKHNRNRPKDDPHYSHPLR